MEDAMNARRLLAALLAVPLIGACASMSHPVARVPDAEVGAIVGQEGPGILRGSQCLDPEMARGWVDLNDHLLLVDSGRFKYLVELAGRCPSLQWTHTLVFRGDPVRGRICGGIGDVVYTRDYPCRVQGLALLDKAQYDALQDARRRARQAARASGSAAR
jgi:hypothetical protein